MPPPAEAVVQGVRAGLDLERSASAIFSSRVGGSGVVSMGRRKQRKRKSKRGRKGVFGEYARVLETDGFFDEIIEQLTGLTG